MEKKVKEIIGEITNKPYLAQVLSDETDIINDVELDSLQMINFILRIEEEFDLEFDYDNFNYDHLSSITNFCQFISRQKEPRVAMS